MFLIRIKISRIHNEEEEGLGKLDTYMTYCK